MPSGSDDASDERDASDPASEGTPYRALLPNGDAFDVVLRERAGRLTLGTAAASADDGEADRRETLTYRFEPVGREDSHDGHFLLVIGGRSVPVTITPGEAEAVHVTLGGRTRAVQVQDETDLLLERFGIAAGAGAAEAEVRAPMPGLVVRVMVEEGKEVSEGDGLLVLEAMKMENELRAPAAGTVTALHIHEGASADKGAVLVEIE